VTWTLPTITLMTVVVGAIWTFLTGAWQHWPVLGIALYVIHAAAKVVRQERNQR